MTKDLITRHLITTDLVKEHLITSALITRHLITTDLVAANLITKHCVTRQRGHYQHNLSSELQTLHYFILSKIPRVAIESDIKCIQYPNT